MFVDWWTLIVRQSHVDIVHSVMLLFAKGVPITGHGD